MKYKRLYKSLIFSVISLIAVVTVNFFLPRLMPGDPVLALIGVDDDYISEEEYDYYFKAMNLDKPLAEQFGLYVKDIFKGDFGYSYHYADKVSNVINKRIPVTLQIALPSIIISALLAMILGTKAGYKNGKFGDKFLTAGNVIINAVPTFLVAMLMVIVFAYELKWLPFGGLNSIFVPDNKWLAFLDRLKHLILPVMTLVIASTPSKYLIMRNTTANQSEEKYVLYLKANGIRNHSVRMKHIFKNICQPFITMVGMNFGKILSGSIIVEMIFSINGMGMLMQEAINNRDFAILQGCLFIIAVMVIFANLITDVICVFLDPRARYGERYE